MSALELYSLKTELLHAIAEASDLAKLEEVRIAALGRKGRIPELMQALGSLPPEERKAYGQVVNSLKTSVGEALEARRAELSKAATVEKLALERADVTLPVRLGPLAEGRIHPVSQVTDEITEIFADMGFSIAEGPDIETDFNNFTALNIPPEHPARQDHDTFYFPEAPDGSRAVLRTHTSPVQIRTMLAQEAAAAHHRAGPRLSLRFGPDAYADVPSGRGAGDRRGDASRPSEMGARGVLQGVLRGAAGQDALPRQPLSVHRAVDGGGYRLRQGGRRDQDRRRRSVARNFGLRHGASECAGAMSGSIRSAIRASPSA